MCVALVQEPQCCNDVLFHATPLNPYSPLPHKKKQVASEGMWIQVVYLFLFKFTGIHVLYYSLYSKRVSIRPEFHFEMNACI